jgi:teichuronic acid biosynthesis glycosyltransferase TuaG
MIKNISVIISTFNRSNCLKRAVDSVLSQTIQPIEILVCEDGLTEETRNIVISFKNSIVKWLPGIHAGRPAIPRNRGIQAANGEWLAFLDDDDVWLSDKLENQLKLLETTRCLAGCSNAWRINPNSAKSKYFNSQFDPIINFNKLLKDNLIITSSVCAQKELIINAGGFPEKETLVVGEDYALWLKISSFTDFCYVDTPLLEYNDEPASSIRNKGGTASEQKSEVFHEFLIWSRFNRKTTYNFNVQFELWLLKHSKSLLARIVMHIRWYFSKSNKF